MRSRRGRASGDRCCQARCLRQARWDLVRVHRLDRGCCADGHECWGPNDPRGVEMTPRRAEPSRASIRKVNSGLVSFIACRQVARNCPKHAGDAKANLPQRIETRRNGGAANARWLRSAVEIALGMTNAEASESRLLQGRFDPFGHNIHAYASGQGADRGDNGRRDVVAVDPRHEGPVDLDLRKGIDLNVRERGIADTEVVERKTDAVIRKLRYRSRVCWVSSSIIDR